MVVAGRFDTAEVDAPFGKRFGDETLTLSAEHLQALQQGNLLVVDVQGEYVLFVELAEDLRRP
ncbi:MAG TPA: hypothetical protein DD435_03760 [Cyanobacteria bacterium UBA8530]|nr:hypothetical protein [Cyanobacteria bacterium UBA8530]